MTLAEPQLTTGRTAREIFGYGPFGHNTREKLIDVAMDLFYAHGIHAVGLDQILSKVGVTKTTFYNHFESKDELIVAVLQQRSRWECETFDREVRRVAGDDPRRMLLALFDVIDRWFTNPIFRGCQFINAAHEFPSPHDPVHQAAKAHGEAMGAWMMGLAERAGADDPRAVAEQLGIIIDGAYTMRLVMRNDEAAAIARATAELVLAKHLPGVLPNHGG